MATEKKAPRAKAAPIRIEGGTFVPTSEGSVTKPSLQFKGEKPARHTVLEFDPGNGVTYSGVVAKAIEKDGKTLVSFEGDVTPKK
ncbi:hypothetical protein NBRC116590_02750 [Pelagimonas sp. KU-00592-HH]|uniref:hypothetical protein n=1 Tax=Pelagimonas sp. KU-00592-HH TaxID=3127651 RepID=UPI00310BE931